MRTQKNRLALLCALLLVTACSLGGGTGEGESESSGSSSSRSSAPETSNVTYTGTVRVAGISVYQEGTHRLILSDGRFVLLESDSVDLNGYVGEEVEILGAVRPTVEAGGTIMRVQSIQLANEGSSSLSSSSSLATSAAQSSQLAASQTSTSTAAVSVPAATSSAASAVATSSASSTVASASSADATGLDARIQLMAAADLSPDRWTQQYCTSHIGFCFPVHRNWWYTSFGTTSSQLWHVEVSTEQIESLGEGPIVVRLMPGALSGSDGAVSVSGGQAIGQRAWSDDRHMEVIADARLEAAVRYITANIEETEIEE